MPPKKRKIILLTAGGTGGHFFPAIALAEELAQNSELEVHISTDNRCRKYLTNDIKIKSHIIDLYINLRGIINKLKIEKREFYERWESLNYLEFCKTNDSLMSVLKEKVEYQDTQTVFSLLYDSNVSNWSKITESLASDFEFTIKEDKLEIIFRTTPLSLTHISCKFQKHRTR